MKFLQFNSLLSSFLLIRLCVIIVLFIGTLSGCRGLKRKEPISKEFGQVVGKQYSPKTSSTATGTGFSSNGNLVVTSHSIETDEQYTVVLKCQHGVIFTVNDPKIYAKVYEKDSVVIDYYNLVDSKGKVRDLDFIDANPIKR